MRIKVEQLAKWLASALSGRAEVECVTVGQAAENDILDPYFSLILDVYFRGRTPGLEDRLELYGKPDHFEADSDGTKDRFFLDDVPVHVNLMSVSSLDSLMAGDDILNMIVRETGTHRLYRVSNCQVLFSRSDWLASVQAALRSLKDPFWQGLQRTYCSKMDHFLSDMGASTLRGDDYFAIVSTSEFLKYAVSALFAFNKRFEPAHRFISEGLRKLPKLPENFLVRWDTLLRNDEELTPTRKFEIAKLLAKSVFGLL